MWLYRLSIPLLLVVGLLLIRLSWLGRDPAMRSALVVAGAGAVTLALLRPGLHGPTSLGPRGFASHLLPIDKARQLIDETFAEVGQEAQGIDIQPATTKDEALGLTVTKRASDEASLTEEARVEKATQDRMQTDHLKRRLAEKLAARVNENICGACGQALPPDWDVPDRRPCPNCGSLARPAWLELR